MQAVPAMNLLAPHVASNATQYAEAFARREPFRHVVIDDFLSADFAAQLLAAFPPFERGNARNEAGELGGKSTIERIRKLGAPYAALDDLIRTPEFLDLIARITGIPGLLYDPHYFGGGTHENRQGQDLDPHIDFNRHPIEQWHRRLNLIVYLNHDWKEDWGGALELHSDPHAPDDRISPITPSYNRCVIFETTEWSWHGFGRIALPQTDAARTRKSIALYFYTHERPADELADTHSTVYVDRPLPKRFSAGVTLDDTDIGVLRTLLARRDQHIQRLYQDAAAQSAQLAQATSALRSGWLGRLAWFIQRALKRPRH
jgi:hypothetical protein